MARPEMSEIVDYVAPRMLYFFISFILYFVLIGFTEKQTIESTVLKCLPIVSLWAFIFLTGFKFEKSQRYAHFILGGLFFSCVGDVLLNYDLVEAGIGGFAIAQIYYMSAFGFYPLRPWVALPVYSFGTATVGLVFNNLPQVIKIGLPIYSILLTTMCWRSLARIDSTKNILRIACGLGGILFLISDSIIAVDMFYTPLNAQFVIMVTYYVGQFGIALSVIEPSRPIPSAKSLASKKSQTGMQKKKKST